MNGDFHYYATYCAALIAGYSHEDAAEICYSANLVDQCSNTFLKKTGGPESAETTQLASDMADTRGDILDLQRITRIWSSFHFLPADLYAEVKKSTVLYKSKYRLICGPNGPLVKETVMLAKDKGNEAAGLAMHVLADTWAHMHFAGTPSFVINNTDYNFRELIPCEEGFRERPINFSHNPGIPEDPAKGHYTSTLFQPSENSIMNLGHGRAGHLPDYSFMRYVYMPAWADYREILKDNPSDYYHAFTQMIYALKYLRGVNEEFRTDVYDTEAAAPYEERVRAILEKRQVNAAEDWKQLGEEISGRELEPFDLNRYQEEYMKVNAEEKDSTFLGSFFLAAMAQKSMVTSRIFQSKNLLAGRSIDYKISGLGGIRDYWKLLKKWREETKK